MVDYKRIKLKISNLPLESAFTVFSFLKELLEEHLLKQQVLQKRLPSFTPGERYFIVHLIKQYYDRFNPKSYINGWLKNRERNSSDHTEFTLMKIKLEINSEGLLNYCNSIEETLKRRFRHQLIHYPRFKEFPTPEQITSVNEVAYSIKSYKEENKPKSFTVIDNEYVRLPVFNNDKPFIRFVRQELSVVLPEEHIKQFINNTFYITAKNTFNPLRYLYLEIDNSGVFYECIFNIYKRYNSDIKKDINDRDNKRMLNRKLRAEAKKAKSLEDYEKRLRSFTLIKFSEKEIKENQVYDFITSFSNKPIKATRFDFMCALYFSFPHIRDSFQNEKHKNPDLLLYDYLSTKSRNIKLRKKSNFGLLPH